MKVILDIAGGYRRGELNEWFNQERGHAVGDADARTAAITKWAQNRYGAWLDANGHSDYAITDVTDTSFAIDFTYEDDADNFRRNIGGRIVEE